MTADEFVAAARLIYPTYGDEEHQREFARRLCSGQVMSADGRTPATPEQRLAAMEKTK